MKVDDAMRGIFVVLLFACSMLALAGYAAGVYNRSKSQMIAKEICQFLSVIVSAVAGGIGSQLDESIKGWELSRINMLKIVSALFIIFSALAFALFNLTGESFGLGIVAAFTLAYIF